MIKVANLRGNNIRHSHEITHSEIISIAEKRQSLNNNTASLKEDNKNSTKTSQNILYYDMELQITVDNIIFHHSFIL